VGLGAGLDAVVKRKMSSPSRDSNLPIIQPVAQRYTAELSRLLFYSDLIRRVVNWTKYVENQGDYV
jgi:hypothetical protein